MRTLPFGAIGAILMGCATTKTMNTKIFALRLHPGQDLRHEILQLVHDQNLNAASIVSGVGSLTEVTLRYAGQPEGTLLKGPFEIVSLTGTVSGDGGHIHISVADKNGRTLGGHLLDGAKVYTTVELTLLEATDLRFSRETDPETTYKELVIKQNP